MKRRALILGSLALSASLLLSACGGSAASSQAASASSEAVASSAAASSEASGESVQLTVFAAASLTETLNEIAEQYKMEADKIKELIPAAELEKDICVEKAINLVRDNANI